MVAKVLELLDQEAKDYATKSFQNQHSPDKDEREDAELDGKISIYIRFHLMPKVEKL